MIQDRSLQLRVGIFVTGGLLLLMLITFMIGNERSWFEDKYRLHCTFDNVSGLGPGASVALAGMRVGSVSAVGFSQDLDNRLVQVELEISKQFQDRIRGDSFASIATQGLLGDKQVVLSVGTAEAAPLPDGGRIQTKLSDDLFSIGDNANQLIGKAHQVFSSVETILGDAQKGGLLHSLLYDESTKDLASDASASVKSLRRLLEKVDDKASQASIAEIVRNMQDASGDISEITAQMRNGEGTLGALLTDASIYEDVRALFGKAQRNKLLRGVVRSMLRERDKLQSQQSK